MKPLLIILIGLFSSTSIVLQAQSETLSNAKDDWMKPPDGYQWPESSPVDLELDVQTRFIDLPTAIQTYLKDEQAPEKPRELIYIRKADLDGDSLPEWFVERADSSGTGGTVYDILRLSNDKVMYLGGVQGGFLLCKPAPGEKWLRIESTSRSGGSIYVRCLQQYNQKAGEYQSVWTEDHDYFHNKVTVRD